MGDDSSQLPRITLSLAVTEQTAESLARLLERRGELDALKSLRLSLVNQETAPTRNFQRYVELAERTGQDASQARREALAAITAPPQLLQQLLHVFRRAKDAHACGVVLERLAADSERPLELLRQAATSFVLTLDRDDASRVLERVTALLSCPSVLSVREYLAWAALADMSTVAAAPSVLARLTSALAQALLRNPDVRTRPGPVFNRLQSDTAALALAREVLRNEGEVTAAVRHRNFLRYVEVAERSGQTASQARHEALAVMHASPHVLQQLLRQFRRVKDGLAYGMVLERLAADGERPLDLLREAATAFLRASDGDNASRVFKRVIELLSPPKALSVREYVTWAKLTQAHADDPEPAVIAQLRSTLAQALLRSPEFKARPGSVLAQLQSDTALALVREALHADDDVSWAVRYYKVRQRQDMLAELQELVARRAADPVPLLLRAAETWEMAKQDDRADLLYREIEPEILAHRTLGDKVVTQSTLMFRNLPVLKALVRLIGDACAASEGTLRVHVAAVSTGEEVYSLAIALQQTGLLERVSLSASDVDRKAVARARRGIIIRKALARVPESAMAWFEEVSPNVLRLAPAILNSIEFFSWDLLQPGHEERQYDFLVANNLSIHLSPADKRRLISQLALHTPANGVVALGGDVHDAEALRAMATADLHPAQSAAAACHQAWSIQRQAWYTLPRPYWALPPFRPSSNGNLRFATFFARSEERLAKIEQSLGQVAMLA